MWKNICPCQFNSSNLLFIPNSSGSMEYDQALFIVNGQSGYLSQFFPSQFLYFLLFQYAKWFSTLVCLMFPFGMGRQQCCALLNSTHKFAQSHYIFQNKNLLDILFSLYPGPDHQNSQPHRGMDQDHWHPDSTSCKNCTSHFCPCFPWAQAQSCQWNHIDWKIGKEKRVNAHWSANKPSASHVIPLLNDQRCFPHLEKLNARD